MFVTNATLAFSPILSQCLSHSDSHKSIVYVKIYTHTEATRDDIQTDAILNTPIVVCIAYSHMRAAYYTKKTLQICSMNELRTHTRTQHSHTSQCGSMLKSVCCTHCFVYDFFLLWFSLLCFSTTHTHVCVLVLVCCCWWCASAVHARSFVCLYVCNSVVAAAEMLSNSNTQRGMCVFMPIYTTFECYTVQLYYTLHTHCVYIMNFKKYGRPMTETQASFRRLLLYYY